MKRKNIDVRKEGTAEGFLGVNIELNKILNAITLMQSGLTKRVITALGLCSSLSRACSTPAETSALPKDADGSRATGTFSYPSVVGMLLYLSLSRHSHPDIAFAVHQCARYTFQPSLKHEIALKRIGRYLKEMIMKPLDDMGIECNPGADFAGLWSHENPNDPHFSHSRLGEKLGLDVDDKTKFYVKIHEDNVGALTLSLGRLEPRHMTPRSKHYAMKYHWFREQIGPRGTTLHKIGINNQLGDIFTKGLGHLLFQQMQEKLMGW